MARRWSVPLLCASVALLAIAVLATGLSPVSGAIPNNGTYSACLTKTTGAVEVINYPKVKCANGRRLIRWSQQGPQGAQGPGGPQGPQGPQGPAGPADWNAIPDKPAGFADGVDNEGVTSVRIRTVTSTPSTIAAPGTASITADCPAGFLAVGGGYILIQGELDFFIYDNGALDADTWLIDVWNPVGAAVIVAAQVHCLRAEPGGLVIAAKNSSYGPKHKKVKLPN